MLGPLDERERKHAPARLYLAGDVELLRRGRRVAVLGARAASAEGRLRAMRIARALAAHGITVVSGLALGIDAAAHEAAIDRGGRTIGVIGTPLSRGYPAANRALQERIRRDHLLVSEFGEDEPVARRNFVLRNRTMALVSHASVIVEAADGSGTLWHAREALRLGRPLFLVRATALDPRNAWPRALLDAGARILREPEELLDALPRE